MNRSTYPLLAPALVATLVTSGLWFALAWRTPTSTFHFAPLISAGIGPVMIRSRIPSRSMTVIGPVLAACAATMGTAISGLAVFDRLQGPTFWSPDGALTESVLFALLGLIAGTPYLLAPRATSEHQSAQN